MDSFGFPRIPMDSYGFLWILTTWIPQDSYVSLRIPKHSYGFLGIPMDS
jgi:hypothetical protein